MHKVYTHTHTHPHTHMAASIILNDIRLTVCNREEDSKLDGTENVDTLVPRSLKLFIHIDCKRCGMDVALLQH